MKAVMCFIKLKDIVPQVSPQSICTMPLQLALAVDFIEMGYCPFQQGNAFNRIRPKIIKKARGEITDL